MGDLCIIFSLDCSLILSLTIACELGYLARPLHYLMYICGSLHFLFIIIFILDLSEEQQLHVVLHMLPGLVPNFNHNFWNIFV